MDVLLWEWVAVSPLLGDLQVHRKPTHWPPDQLCQAHPDPSSHDRADGPRARLNKSVLTTSATSPGSAGAP